MRIMQNENQKKIASSNELRIAFAGGGTGGHVYPGLAVANELRYYAKKHDISIKLFWIGSANGNDKTFVEKSFFENGKKTIDHFFAIPSGKLRRYFSFQNFFDAFKILAGFFASIFILKKIKPTILFSKGGFVSVPPCVASSLLGIKVFTHECDFTPGLATKINARFANAILLSYDETKKFFKSDAQKKCIVTGNPVRSAFYHADGKKGLAFLHRETKTKPILLALGGSSGAKQINDLILENLDFLCEHFAVVHQTGKNVDAQKVKRAREQFENYNAYEFIFDEISDVLASADIVVSRAGANAIWEIAVLGKPAILIPLAGSGTRGDQEENAHFFEEKGAAFVLAKENATSEKLKETVLKILENENYEKMQKAILTLANKERNDKVIAKLLLDNANV